MPHSDDPQPPNRVEENRAVSQATELGDEEYHSLADAYMDTVHEKAEALQEAREDVEVDYSVCTLTYPALLCLMYISKYESMLLTTLLCEYRPAS